MKKVEQILSSGAVVMDYDHSFTHKDIVEILSRYFTDVKREKYGFHARFQGREYLLLVKNITYLGHPHPVFKKRIQIPVTWNDLLVREDVVLMGLYEYDGNRIFAFFDKKRRGKSSSAHIYSIDIQKASEYGTFQKTDKYGNHIVACRADKLLSVFGGIVSGRKVDDAPEIALFDDFFGSLPQTWQGISAYKEMIKSGFPNRFQSEWPGFYLEFNFDRFISEKPGYGMLCRYVRNKKKEELDFDLDFVRGKFVGDLKTHAKSSSAILGNDKESVSKALKAYGRIWYVVFAFEYRMDKDFDCEVSQYWNSVLNTEKGKEKKPTSYCKKMKHDGSLLSMNILELNRYNSQHISDFHQGKQPNGAARAVKIMIQKGMIDNFVIFRKHIQAPSTER